MCKNSYNTVFVIAFLFLSHFTRAQEWHSVSITGPTSVMVGDQATYTIDLQSILAPYGQEYVMQANWFTSYEYGTQIISSTNSSFTVKWNEKGINGVQIELFTNLGYYYGGSTDDITINSPLPGTPTAYFGIYNITCGSTDVTAYGEPLPGEEWYWQRTADGTSTELGSSPSINVTQPGYLYLRSRFIDPPYTWGTSSQYVGNIGVQTYGPPEPAAAYDGHIITNNATASVQLSVSQVDMVSIYRWYTQPVGGAIIFQNTSGLSGYTTTVSAPQTDFYVESHWYGCPSSKRTKVTAYKHPLPEISLVEDGSALSVNNHPYDRYQWFKEGGNAIAGATAANYMPTISGSYYVEAWVGTANGRSTSRQFTAPLPILKLILPQAKEKYLATEHIGIQVKINSGYPVEAELRKGNVRLMAGIWLGDNGIAYIPAAGLAPGDDYEVIVDGRVGSASSGYFSIAAPISLGSLENQNMNFTVATKVLKSGVLTTPDINNLPPSKKQQTVNYLDELGRVLQNIAVKGSPNGYDIVSHERYLPLNKKYSYLPMIAATSDGRYKGDVINSNGDYTTSAHYSFFTTNGLIQDTAPYVVSVFEKSPVGRLLEQGDVGASNQGKAIQYTYGFNAPLALWEGSEVNSVFTFTKVNCAAGKLSLTTGVNGADENRYKSEVYKDVEGITRITREQISATGWKETHYVYNDKGWLIAKLTPELNKKLQDQNLNQISYITGGLIDQFAFLYRYDVKGREIESKSPHQGWIYAAYDVEDRVVLTQDANMRIQNQWKYVKYDQWGRVVLSGLVTLTQSISQIRNSATRVSPLYESRGGAFHGYTNVTYPTTIDPNQCLEVKYYDDYSFKSLLMPIYQGTYDYKGDELDDLPAVPFSRVSGLPTGSKVKAFLGSDEYNEWLGTVVYYNEKQVPIQTVTQNHMGGAERKSVTFNFAGVQQQTRKTHTSAYEDHTVLESFTSDDYGRLLKTHHQVDMQPSVELTAPEYNIFGQVRRQNIHSTDNGSTYLQGIDYTYDIKGRITSINHPAASHIDANDYFGLSLQYQDNGLLSQTRWRNDLSDKEHEYSFAFDGQKYMKDAVYRKKTANNLYTDTDRYSEKNLEYDYNGNIKKLQRYGVSGLVDNLTYEYAGNQLLRVTDNTQFATGFKDGNTTGNDYAYDSNGNLISDANKGISSIEYNFLNLPTKVAFTDGTSVEYLYAANGTRLKQTNYAASGDITTWKDYTGILEYTEDLVTSIVHAAGRIIPRSIDGETNWEYQYYLNDHLGNVQVILGTQPETTSQKATLETGYTITEQNYFLRYNQVRSVKSPLFDKTNGANTGYSQRLNGSLNEKFGLARSLSVMPGDVINAEVYAKYVDTNSSNWTGALNTLITQIASGTAPVGTVIDGIGYSSSTSSFSYAGLLNRDGDNGTGPKAYLNWLVFDRDFNFLNGGYSRLSSAAREYGQNVVHEKLSAQINIKQAGYVYCYLSNEEGTPVEVYFDDFKVEHIESPAEQINGYYPFGLAAYTYLREGEKETNYRFQGKEYDDKTGWHDFHARQYDPALGRWFAPDPAEQFASPYMAMGNLPGSAVDPDGQIAFAVVPLIVVVAKAIAITTASLVIADAMGTIDITMMSSKDIGRAWTRGAVSGLLTAGIGSAFGSASGVGVEVARAAAHGMSSVTVDVMFGGEPTFSSFATGFVSSIMSSCAGAAFNRISATHSWNAYQANAVGGGITFGTGILSGGITSKMTGESFAKGAVNGGIIALFNHIMSHATQGPGPDYSTYDKSIPVEDYNCAGLAFRTYRWMTLNEVETILNSNKISGAGKAGNIKVWLWKYNVSIELSDGTKVSGPSADFHIVAGRVGSNGMDPTNVYSKNGGRPVFGPGTGTSWTPLGKEQAFSNDHFNTPAYYNGLAIMKIRTQIVQQIFIIPYRKY